MFRALIWWGLEAGICHTGGNFVIVVIRVQVIEETAEGHRIDEPGNIGVIPPVVLIGAAIVIVLI